MFQITTGTCWEDISKYGNYSVSTVYKYYTLWCNNGLFNDLFAITLKRYSELRNIRWKHQDIDSTIIKTVRGGESIGGKLNR